MFAYLIEPWQPVPITRSVTGPICGPETNPSYRGPAAMVTGMETNFLERGERLQHL